MTKKHHEHEHDHGHAHSGQHHDKDHSDHKKHTVEELAAELAASQAAIAELEQKAEANWDKFIRVTADMENVRKRAHNDVDNARKFALEKFMHELIPVLDSIEQGLLSAQSDSADATFASVYQGLELTHKQLYSVLHKFGLVVLTPEGEKFDPHLHEAMLMQPGSGQPSGIILTVVQKGYQLNGRLVRPARVIVAQ